MANTTNLNMVKPAGTDHALISVINSNMDIIDGAVGALPSGTTLQGEIDSANTAIGNLQGQASRTIQWISSGSLDDCTDPTKVYSWGNVSVSNIPAIYAKMYYIPGDVPMQYCVTNDGTSSMIRVNTGSWSSWTYIASKSEIEKLALPQTTKTTKQSFSGASGNSATFTLTNPGMVTVAAYNGGAVNIYSPSGSTEFAICSAYAPPGWAQSSCGNSVYCKAGTYTVYYFGTSSSSSGSVVAWS